MGKYQAYTEYTASNATWLDKYPSHWRLTQVKYGYQVVLGKMLQKSPKSSIDSLKPYLKAQNIQPKGVDTSRVDSMWFSPEELHKLRLQKGDVLVSEGGDVGRSAIWNNELAECYIQNAINRVRPLGQNCSRYFNYWIYSLKSSDFINILCNKATIAHYTAEKLEASPLLLPSSVEQTQIANFLDHETAKIDTLIEKQQQLIKLLKEKRQAVISHAVTKGLNPQAPMKDSGVEWLGEVPEHWEVTRLKYDCSEIVDCPHSTPQYSDDGVYPAIRTADIHVGFLDVDKARRVTENVYHQRNLRLAPKPGDIIYSREGERYGIGALVPENTNVCLAQRVMLFRAKDTSEFLMWAINSQAVYKQAQQDVIGATAPHVNVVTIKNFSLAWPPKEEREEISNHIRSVTSSMDELILVAGKKMGLLQERRTALISAAVTGKIDVRNWQAPGVQHAVSVHEPPLEAMA
ncbi:restriction endonuclease subunit S [Photobacterium halotolerans]|uniref:restriction endonuclease subunit S n=1 Tax=Photobacterium halotolerans TaxID=265726 RepID=UPI000619ACEF|nr:restriction endonuclease subunit S [Photobacterium halotolerans]